MNHSVPTRRASDLDWSGDGGVAVGILAAGSDQVECALFQLAVGFFRDPVMHHGTIRPGARDGGEREVAQAVVEPAEAFELGRGAEFVDAALRCRGIEPGEEAADRTSTSLNSSH